MTSAGSRARSADVQDVQDVQEEAQEAQEAQAGFTLVEVLAVLVIIALLAALAVPALSRDTAKSDYDKLVSKLTQDMQSAKFEAISSREDRAILFTGGSYWRVTAVTPGTTAFATLREQAVSGQVEIAGFQTGAQQTAGSSPTACATAELRFTSTGEVGACGDPIAPCGGNPPGPRSLTIYLHSVNDEYRSRVVVFQSTGFSRLIDGW